MKKADVCDVTPCIFVDIDQNSGLIFRIDIQYKYFEVSCILLVSNSISTVSRPRLQCFFFSFATLCCAGVRGGAVGWGTALQVGKSRVRFPMVSFESTQSFQPHYGLGVESASNRNEYQEYLLACKGGRCIGLTTLPPSCADCLEIWEHHPPGTLNSRPGLYRDCFTFTFCCAALITNIN